MGLFSVSDVFFCRCAFERPRHVCGVREIPRRLAAIVLQSSVDLSCSQHFLNYVYLAVDDGPVQAGVAELGGGVDIRAILNEQTEDIDVTLARSTVQRSHARGAVDLDVGVDATACQRCGHVRRIPVLGGQVQILRSLQCRAAVPEFRQARFSAFGGTVEHDHAPVREVQVPAAAEERVAEHLRKALRSTGGVGFQAPEDQVVRGRPLDLLELVEFDAVPAEGKVFQVCRFHNVVRLRAQEQRDTVLDAQAIQRHSEGPHVKRWAAEDLIRPGESTNPLFPRRPVVPRLPLRLDLESPD